MPIFYLIILLLPAFISTETVVLTDKTWKEMFCGQWMVEFYAPWCPSCQHFTPTWDEFAKAMIPKDIKVASVDINQYPSLSGRFGIAVLPTIYYVHDGVFRQFQGERSLQNLKNYIEFQEWQKTPPVPWYLAPDSIPMSIIGSIFDVSLLVKDAYTTLHDQYGWPAWLIYIVLSLVVIFVGLILGFGVLMLLDYCLTSFSKDEPVYIPDDSRDVEDLDDFDDQKLLKPKNVTKASNSGPALLASSTPQRGTLAQRRPIPVQDDEDLLNEVLGNDQEDEGGHASDELNASDIHAGTDDDDDDDDDDGSERGDLNLRRRK